jgi:acyl-coenzyme A thioesterase PaaI-like protein
MEQRTHEQIARHLCGEPLELEPGHARVALDTAPEMAADERGLVHGGFTFGLADYAVVLASAQTKFIGPVVVGERMEAEATVDRTDGRKRWVKVVVRRAGAPVFEGEFLTVVLAKHILDK